jgi:histidine triad (HIT) family protein
MIAGELPARLVYEDELVIAFHDIAPQAPVHALVVPRRHVKNLSDQPDPEVLAALFTAVPEVARLLGVDESGYRVIVNNGADARQSVDHLHVHVLGGRPMLHGMMRYADE